MRVARSERPQKWPYGRLVVLTFLAVFLIVFHSWAYIDAWLAATEPVQSDREQMLQAALKRQGVAALREQSVISVLKASDVAAIKASRCTYSLECVRMSSSRRSLDYCKEVRTDHFCAYEIVDSDRKPAVAFLKAHRNDLYKPDLYPSAGDFIFNVRMIVEPPDLDLARSRLCGMGYCRPSSEIRFIR